MADEPRSLQDLLQRTPLHLLHPFACDCAEEALQRERQDGREPDPRSWEAVRLKRLWLDEKINLSILRLAQRGASSAVSAIEGSLPTTPPYAAQQAARSAMMAASLEREKLQHALFHAAFHAALRPSPPNHTASSLILQAEEERQQARLQSLLWAYEHAQQRLLRLLTRRHLQLVQRLQGESLHLDHALFEENVSSHPKSTGTS